MVRRGARDAARAGPSSGSSSSARGGVGVDGDKLVDVLQTFQRGDPLSRGGQKEGGDAGELEPLADLVEEGLPGVAIRHGDGDLSARCLRLEVVEVEVESSHGGRVSLKERKQKMKKKMKTKNGNRLLVPSRDCAFDRDENQARGLL